MLLLVVAFGGGGRGGPLAGVPRPPDESDGLGGGGGGYVEADEYGAGEAAGELKDIRRLFLNTWMYCTSVDAHLGCSERPVWF